MSCSMSGVPRMNEMYRRMNHASGLTLLIRPSAMSTPSGKDPMSVMMKIWKVTTRPPPMRIRRVDSVRLPSSPIYAAPNWFMKVTMSKGILRDVSHKKGAHLLRQAPYVSAVMR